MPAGRLNARIALGELTTEEALAIAEMPAELSGVSEKQRGQVFEKTILANNPETAGEISDLEEAIFALDGALRAATSTLKSDASVGQADLDKMLGTMAHKEFIRELLGDDAPEDEPDELPKEDAASDDDSDLGEDSK